MTDPDLRRRLEALPHEVSTTQFAELANCSKSTVLNMIRQNTIPARVLNPESKRPTYRIPTQALRNLLGVEEPRPYQSRHFPNLPE